ncbi:MAG: AAA family ATPase [Methylococcus sp.]
MRELRLNSLEIKNFRCFEHLVIEKLGRVNLIVGKNSLGKSSLLEGLQIYAHRGDPNTLAEILKHRREMDFEDLSHHNDRFRIDLTRALSFLFHNRDHEIGDTKPITMGPAIPPGETFKLNIMWYGEIPTEEGLRLAGPVTPDDYDQFSSLTPRVTVQIGDQQPRSFPATYGRTVALRSGSKEGDKIPCCYIPVNGLASDSLTPLWDRAIIQQDKPLIKQVLAAIIPDITDINLLNNAIIAIDTVNSAPLPIQTFGEGLARAFGIGLALVNARQGFLLIDEFETGLHHTIQTDVWRFIFSIAKSLNVQVFATTHSWDCVEAFQRASAEDQHEEAMLIRLQHKKGGAGIEAESYGERLLGIATRQGVEVR